MQASVHTYDLDARTGEVLLDTGRVLPFPAAAVEASGLRHLRVGQRVCIEVAEGADPETAGATVSRVWIVGIGEGETIT
ncbi:hypothetical protein [uncultured Serinicoccus sp.]|uniref:hypothetical protein n=1 Tax=uncultured Serinicoccus sp. TaxID=735514 RepID=UPI00261EEB4D|nr:hypothetical protein [uncultured Serinicoccus sp.]